MKVHLLVTAVALFLLTACKDNTTETIQEKKTVIQEAHNEALGDKDADQLKEAPVTTLSFEGVVAPQFKDEALNQWVRAYVSFLTKWKNASKSGKRQNFNMPSTEALQSLSSDPAEEKKYTDFMDAIAPKISAMMKTL